MSKFAFVDCYAGAGGLSLGLRGAGLEPVFAFDLDELACRTYASNIGPVVHRMASQDVGDSEIQRITGLSAGEYTLVAGGPPCQGFSIQRRGDRADPRNSEVIRFAQLAAALRPLMILMENVPTLLGERGRDQVNSYLSHLDSRGYDSLTGILDAAAFGAPQKRRRAFIASWDRSRVGRFRFPEATRAPSEYRTVRDAISDMPEPPQDFSEHPEFPNHRRVRMSDLNLKRISLVPSGGGRLDLPEHLQLDCHRTAGAHRHLDVYGRMEWDKPAPTITASFDNFTRGRFAHPTSDRSITAREGARLQTFPDSFKFAGPKKNVARQIGNAVPVVLAQALGAAILDTIGLPNTNGDLEEQLALAI